MVLARLTLLYGLLSKEMPLKTLHLRQIKYLRSFGTLTESSMIKLERMKHHRLYSISVPTVKDCSQRF